MQSFDFSCSMQCHDFLQILHGKNKLLNHEELLDFGRLVASVSCSNLH